jgi:hypothetical protein
MNFKRIGHCLLFTGVVLIVSCSPNGEKNNEEVANEFPGNPKGRLDTWEFVGPGGGGAMFSPTVSPHDPGVALVSCDMTGSYITKSLADVQFEGSRAFLGF